MTQKRDIVKFAPNVPVEVALKFALPGRIISTQNGERMMYTLADDRVMFLDLGVAKKVNDLGVNLREKFFVCRPPNGKADAEWSVWLSPETEKARAKLKVEAAAQSKPAAEPEAAAKPNSLLHEKTPLEQKLWESLELVQKGKVGELGNGMFAVPAGASVAAPAPVVADAQNGHQPTVNRNGSTKGVNGKNGSGGNSREGGGIKYPEQAAWAEYLLGETDALVDVYASALSNASSKHGNHVKPEDVRSLLVTVFIQRSKGLPYGL